MVAPMWGSHFVRAIAKPCCFGREELAIAKVVPRGLEPRTLRLLALRSDQLSYETCMVVKCTYFSHARVLFSTHRLYTLRLGGACGRFMQWPLVLAPDIGWVRHSSTHVLARCWFGRGSFLDLDTIIQNNQVGIQRPTHEGELRVGLGTTLVFAYTQAGSNCRPSAC